MYLGSEQTATGDVLRMPVTDVALAELDHVYSFLYARVGNRSDAEDLTQQVALKALPRLRAGSSGGSVRAYLYATARSMLGAFWAQRFRLPQSTLGDDIAGDANSAAPQASAADRAWLERTLAGLSPPHRAVLELRFLRGCSIREVAAELGKTEGAVKVMQLRALRAAAEVSLPDRSRRERPLREAVPGSASLPRP